MRSNSPCNGVLSIPMLHFGHLTTPPSKEHLSYQLVFEQDAMLNVVKIEDSNCLLYKAKKAKHYS